MPIIHDPIEFKKALSATQGQNLVFDVSGAAMPQNLEKEIGLWIGPEGGWTDEELNQAKEKSLQVVSLSQLTFRGETVAVIGVYLATTVRT